MIKTLRITSIIAAILAIGLFVFPVVFGFRSDEEIERFLKSPGAIEKFRQAKGGRTRGNGDQISPLVKQAGAFALYLNPPKPIEPERRGQPPVEKVPEIPRGPVTAKFTLVATSVNEARPEESLALINEPGKGLNWVRQSDVVAHLTFERIEDGRVILKGGKGTSVLSVEARPPRRSLLADSSSTSIVSKSPISLGSHKAEPGAAADGRITSIEPTMTSKEERALAEKIFAELEAMAKEAGPGETDSQSGDKEGTAATGKIIPSSPEATRISGEEAKNLGDLGQELKDVQRDPSRAKVRKGLRDRKSWRDRRNQMIKEREKARAKALAERNKPVEE